MLHAMLLIKEYPGRERDNEKGSLCSGPEIAFLQFYDVIVEIVMSGTIYRVKL